MTNNCKIAKGFTVSHINVRSLINKIDEISTIIYNHKLDVLTISESWLREDIENTCIKHTTHNLYRQDRKGPHITKSKGGGLITYVDNKYKVDDKLHAHLNCCNQHLEAQVLELRRENHKRAIIVNLYRPPSGNQQIFIEQLSDIVLGVKNQRYHDLYFTGDLNLDHTNNKMNEITKDLIALLKANGLTQVITDPTRKTKSSATILDVIYIKTTKNIQSKIIPTSVSDHYLVVSTVYLDYKVPPKTTITGRSYKKYSKDLAREYYSRQRTDLIYQYNDVNVIWSNLSKYIKNCANTLCPVKQMTINSNKPNWITTELIEMINEKNKAFIQAYCSGNPNDLCPTKKLRTDTKRAIRNARADFIKQRIADVSDNPRKFWMELNNCNISQLY